MEPGTVQDSHKSSSARVERIIYDEVRAAPPVPPTRSQQTGTAPSPRATVETLKAPRIARNMMPAHLDGTDDRRPGLVPPAPEAPPWLHVLTVHSQRLALATPPMNVAARMVVAAPSTAHIGAAAALSTVRPPTSEQIPLNHGQRVATVVSGKFVDGRVSISGRGRIAINGVEFANGLPPLQVIEPEAFPGRKPAPVPDEGGRVAVRLRSDRPDDWAFQRVCLRPVVVLTNEPSTFITDLADLASASHWWSPLRRAALVNPRAGVEWWLRRPIVVLTPRAARQHPWLASLPLTAVIIVGFTVWADPARLLWPHAPHMLVLGQRHGVDRFREWFDGTEFAALDTAFGIGFQSSGLAATAFGEPIGGDRDPEDEWDF